MRHDHSAAETAGEERGLRAQVEAALLRLAVALEALAAEDFVDLAGAVVGIARKDGRRKNQHQTHSGHRAGQPSRAAIRHGHRRPHDNTL